MTTLEQFVEAASKRAEKIFYRTGQVLPLYHAIRRNGDNLIVPMPDPDKDTAVAMMRALFELEDVVRYVFIDEAWTFLGGDDPKAMQLAVDLAAQSRLSEHPNRKEVLAFMAEDQDGGLLRGEREIVRKGGKAKLGPLKIDRMDGLSMGRMVGLLPKPKGKAQ